MKRKILITIAITVLLIPLAGNVIAEEDEDWQVELIVEDDVLTEGYLTIGMSEEPQTETTPPLPFDHVRWIVEAEDESWSLYEVEHQEEYTWSTVVQAQVEEEDEEEVEPVLSWDLEELPEGITATMVIGDEEIDMRETTEYVWDPVFVGGIAAIEPEVIIEEEPPEEHDLTINAEEGGTTDPEPGTYSYEEGTEVTVEAIPDEGYEFVEWTGDETGTDETITVTMDEDKEITANFEEEPVETYSVSLMDLVGEGSVTVNGDVLDDVTDSVEIEEGTEITISADPDFGWTFDSWSLDAAGEEDETFTTTIEEDFDIGVEFTEIDTDWEPGVTYPEDFVIIHDGVEYEARRTHESRDGLQPGTIPGRLVWRRTR